MQPDSKKTGYFTAAIVLWLLAFIVCVVLNAFSHHPRTVLTDYLTAGYGWIHQENLYNLHQIGAFNYFLPAALIFVPLTLLPLPVSLLIWGLLMFAGLIAAVWLVAKNLANNSLQKGRYFLLMTLGCVMIGFDALRNGQMTVAILFIALFLSQYFVDERPWFGALLLSVGIILKPIMIVPCLLVLGHHLKLTWRMVVLLLLLSLIPFLTQSFHYVTTQYHLSYLNLMKTVNMGMHGYDWASLLNALHVIFGLNLSSGSQLVILTVAALATYGASWYFRCYASKKQFYFVLMYLAMLYLVLFNPRTENNGYVLLAPFIGYLIARAWELRQWLRMVPLACVMLGITMNYYLSKTITPAHHMWLSPFLSCWLVVDLCLAQKTFLKTA